MVLETLVVEGQTSREVERPQILIAEPEYELPERLIRTLPFAIPVRVLPLASNEVERRGVRRLETKLIYPNHRSPTWLAGDHTQRSLEPIFRR